MKTSKSMKALCTAFLLFMGLTWIQGQDVKFSVEVSNDTLLVGNYFELKYTVENGSPNGFEPPNLNIADVVGGPNSSTSMSIINGEMSQSASYAYYIRPSDIGAYTIPPAYLKDGDRTLEAPPIEIIVLPNPEGIVQRPHQAGKKYLPLNSSPEEDAKPTRPRKKF
jgi:hypothetical protein